MTLDAEDHTTAESRMAILHELRREFDWVGTVCRLISSERRRIAVNYRLRCSHPAVQARTTSRRRWPIDLPVRSTSPICAAWRF